jgi:hypothetical protein
VREGARIPSCGFAGGLSKRLELEREAEKPKRTYHGHEVADAGHEISARM